LWTHTHHFKKVALRERAHPYTFSCGRFLLHHKIPGI